MTTEESITEQRRAELEEIRMAAGGVLKPEDVVEFARAEDTALHGAFCWDDTEAAKQHRLWQARQVIRVCVTISDKPKEQPIRTYVSLYEDRGQDGYRLLTDVLSDDEMREKLLSQALAELKTWQQKYKQLEKLAPIFAAAEKVERRHAGGGAGNGSKRRVAAAMA